MPWLAVLYMTANITLNLTAIALVKRGGAVGTMVASTLLVPVYGLVFCLNIPLLAPTPFSLGFCKWSRGGDCWFNSLQPRQARPFALKATKSGRSAGGES